MATAKRATIREPYLPSRTFPFYALLTPPSVQHHCQDQLLVTRKAANAKTSIVISCAKTEAAGASLNGAWRM